MECLNLYAMIKVLGVLAVAGILLFILALIVYASFIDWLRSLRK